MDVTLYLALIRRGRRPNVIESETDEWMDGYGWGCCTYFPSATAAVFMSGRRTRKSRAPSFTTTADRAQQRAQSGGLRDPEHGVFKHL